MPPYNMNVLVGSVQSNLSLISSFVMMGQTIIAMLLFVGAGTVFRLAYQQWAATAFPTKEDNRALLSHPCAHPVSRTAVPIAGVNGSRVYACPTAARPRAPALSPSAPVTDEGFEKGKGNITRGAGSL